LQIDHEAAAVRKGVRFQYGEVGRADRSGAFMPPGAIPRPTNGDGARPRGNLRPVNGRCRKPSYSVQTNLRR
jgi:hypothetical protein